MQTNIHSRFKSHPEITVAESILRACVHCGFCNATCPTYLTLGDERDGPRGRIYLIKQLLETGSASKESQVHLDRCLTCRSCETTCPSGVQYGKLFDIGRGILEADLPRPFGVRVKRWFLKNIVTSAVRFRAALALARIVKPVLPADLRRKIPTRQRVDAEPATAAAECTRSMIILAGCAQAAATPATNTAARRVFSRLGISLKQAPAAGCCGAMHYHLGDHERGLNLMKKNIDAWWPLIESSAEAIVSSASGCGATIRDYGHYLRNDPKYAKKAARISSLARDLSEALSTEDISSLSLHPARSKSASHCPCSLSHGQRHGATLQNVLEVAGVRFAETKDAHLCCGSAGAYSILQPKMSAHLKKNKLAALQFDKPDEILTANVGCQLHLASESDVPVRHWIEAIDARLPDDNSLAREK